MDCILTFFRSVDNYFTGSLLGDSPPGVLGEPTLVCARTTVVLRFSLRFISVCLNKLLVLYNQDFFECVYSQLHVRHAKMNNDTNRKYMNKRNKKKKNDAWWYEDMKKRVHGEEWRDGRPCVWYVSLSEDSVFSAVVVVVVA